jgi:hypothetical protein
MLTPDDLLSLFPKMMRRRRCGARNQNLFKKSRTGLLTVSRDPFCKAWAMRGSCRCRMHGGASTGPKTEEGKARSIAALVAGRRRWLESMKAKGEKLTCGRKPGEAWVTPAMKQREFERQRAEAARQEAERWAALTPQQRFVERHEAITAGAVSAIDELIRRLERS